MKKRIWAWMLLAGLVADAGAAWAARVVPNRFDLAQEPGTAVSYTLILEGDRSEPEELRLYLGDWERLPSGEHDWGIPANGARWTSARAFAAGESFTVQYRVSGASPDTGVSGSYRSGVPQAAGAISGAAALDGAAVAAASPEGEISVSRRVAGDVVTLEVACRIAFEALTILEVFSGPVALTAIDAAGGQFDTVERSCTDWISLGDAVIQLQPGERREVAFRVTTPSSYDGSYWSALFVEAPPQVVDQGGTRILSIPRTAIKIFVTAPGTEVVAAAITAVDVVAAAPLALIASLQNTGNVEMAVAGEVQVIDRTGVVVRSIAVSDVKVLPGATRAISFADAVGAVALTSGIYQATVQLEYGGGGPVVGVRGFRIP